MTPRRSTVQGMTARDKFAKGDRVKLSARGLEHLRTLSRRGKRAYDRDTRGTVIGFGHSPEVVGIVRDGLTTREAYHVTLWEVDRKPVDDPRRPLTEGLHPTGRP